MIRVFSVFISKYSGMKKTMLLFGIPVLLAFFSFFIYLCGYLFNAKISGFLMWLAITSGSYAVILYILSLCWGGGGYFGITKKDFPALCGIVLIGCAVILSVISRSQTVYFWDSAGYWMESLWQGNNIFSSSPFVILKEILRRIRDDEYNNFIATLVSVPLRFLGKSYIAFGMVIFVMFIVPAAFILSVTIKKISEKINLPSLSTWQLMPLFIMISGMLQPLFGGYFDAAVLIPVATLLLVTFSLDFKQFETKKYICIAGLCLAILLIRRYFGFFVVGYVFALFIKAFCDWLFEKKERNAILKNYFLSMLFIGSICALVLLVFFMPLLKRNLLVNYREIYSAYKSSSLLGNIQNICRYFGAFPLFFAAGGLVYLFVKAKRFALFIVSSLVVSAFLFLRVQNMGIHQRYILTAQLALLTGMGITVCCSVLQKKCGKKITIAAIYSICSIVFILNFLPINNFLISNAKIRPIVRNDMFTLGQIIADANEGKKPLYVLASSGVLNWQILQLYGLPFQDNVSPYFLVTHDIDLRDGFNVQLMQAEMVLVADPVQLHLTKGQEIIQIPAREILNGTGIGEKYCFVKEYQLDRGVKAKLYERTEPYTQSDGEYLSGIFDTLYPNYKHIFRERIMSEF